VNVEGRWQSVPGAARPPGEGAPGVEGPARPRESPRAPGFDYVSSEEIRDELLRELGGAVAPPSVPFVPARLAAVDSTRELGIYGVDAIVRRSGRCRRRGTAAPMRGRCR